MTAGRRLPPDRACHTDRSAAGLESGSLSTELALVLPVVLVGFVALVMLAGRLVQAETDVTSAAQEGARAATFENNLVEARSRASATVTANLATAGLSCQAGGPVVQTISSDGQAVLRPGVVLTVTVSCTADLRDVAHLAGGGTRTFTATAHEVVDTYRSSP